MGMKHKIPCKQLFCPFTHPRSLGGVKRLKHFFSEEPEGHNAYNVLNYKERSLEHYVSKMFDLMLICQTLKLCRLAYFD